MSDIPHVPSNPVPDPTGSTHATVRLEPFTENIIVPVPWYKRLFSGPQIQTQTIWRLSVVAILVVGILIGRQMQSGTKTGIESTRVQAAVGKARISIYPLETKIPPEKSFQLWMTSDQGISSADIVITFNPKAIQLSKEVSTQASEASEITFESWTKANTTGQMVFHMQPKIKGTPIPAGTEQFATFFFKVAKGSTDLSTNIMVSEEKSKVIGQDNVPFALTTTNASVGLK